MRKILCAALLSAGLLTNAPAHADGLPVMDTISNLFDGISASIDQTMETVTKKWQAFMESTAGKTLTQVEETVKKVQGVTDKVQEVYDKTFAFMNDPKGSVIDAVGLKKDKVDNLQYLPDSYGDEQVKTFEGGKNSAINGFAQETYDQIKEGSDDLVNLSANYKGRYELAVPDRDAREAAYYLAMAEESYHKASQRYEDISKDYLEKIKNAREVKEKENLQMNLQAEHLLLQSQAIQLDALKQTHDARKEVAELRRQELQKIKKDMRRITLL